MAKFRDRAGRLWMIPASGDRLAAVRKQLGVDLRKPASFEQMNQETAAAVLFVYAQPEIGAYKMNRTDFERNFNGEKIAAALQAIRDDMGQMK